MFPVSQDLLEVEDCELPFKESIRTREKILQGWRFGDYREGEKVKGVPIYKFIDRILENNIGKSFDETYSYYCRKTTHIEDSKHWWFMKEFNGRFPDYMIDEEGLIQRVPEKYSWNKEWNKEWRQKFETKLKPFYYYDCKIEWVNQKTGEKWKKYAWYSVQDEPIGGDWKKIATQGYMVENVQTNSKLWVRLTYEKMQARRLAKKEEKRIRKQKEYSLLSQSEIALKKAKLEDENILLKHGFDDESFKGSHYHGRKNKKKNG